MTHILRTILEALVEVRMCFLLKDFSISCTYSIPEFWLSKVQIIDSRQLHVLSVPAEERLPRSNIAIWSVHAWQLISKAHVQY
jgi:hypothetical protein